jgi:glycosyltransferase involved in cell wall biosynthesis
MKGKILTSLRVGLPTVSSSIGSEGFALTPGEDILVEDDPSMFADAVIRLYTDEAMWTRLSQKELEFARKNFSFDRSRDLFHRLLSEIEVDRLSRSTGSKIDAESSRSTSQSQRDIRKAKPVCVTK